MSITSAEFKEVLLYPVQDKQWFVKLCLQVGLMFLLCFFLVGIPFLTGYMVRCTQKGINKDNTLPDWNEWGLFWKLGWKIIGVSLVFSLPAVLLIIFFIALVVLIIILNLSGLVSESAYVIIGLSGMMVYFVMLVYSLAMMFLQPAYLAAVAAGKSFRDCIAIKKMLWPYIKANAITILVGLAILYLIGIIAMLGMFVFFVGIFLTYGYYIAAGGYTYGLIYRQSTVKF
jgi:hypothetical protein